MYTEQQFSIHPLTGISEKSVEEHKKLYAGYVKHANFILSHINELSKDSEKYAYELAELQRRFSFEYCGMRNHECYFNLLTGGIQAINPESDLAKAISAQWGSYEAWLARFQSIALTRGVGWAMLYYDPSAKELVHSWVDEQHLGQLSGCQIIIALDMWEHSYVYDYQPSGKKQYVVDFMNQLNWSVAEAHFAAAVKNS